MSVFLDVLLLAVFVFTVINNYRYGFICSILRMARFFICLFVAHIFAADLLQYILIFIISFAALTALLFVLRRIELPVITKADKFLGLALGVFLGLLYASIISSVAYGTVELLSEMGNESMSVYDDSTVFKFVYDLGFFDFIFGAL